MVRRACIGVVLVLACLVAPARADEVVDGQVGSGALYRLVRPTNWNGSLVVYAHGFVGPEQPVALPAEADSIVGLLAPQGFAVAFSSFSENGWVVKDGAQRTHQLLGIFKAAFARPTRVYVAGASMGGLIAVKLAEKHPRTYEGALAACAASAGTLPLFDYHAHARVLFDYFYPGVLPGTAVEVPPGTDVNQDVVLPALAAMTANPLPAFTMAAIDQTPFPYAHANPAELFESIVTAIASNAGDRDLLRPLTHGRPYFENRKTRYSSALLPAPLLEALNAGVGRFKASPSAREALEREYDPSGKLRNPMLMLSDARDPVVPGFNQASYAAAVADKGTEDLLVQRQVDAYGHCVFTPAELGAAFSDLVLWVELGIKPLP